MNANDRALRDALIHVLDTYGVDYRDINRNGTPMLSFNVNRMTYRFGYHADAERGSVRKLLNLLQQAGLQPKDLPPAPQSELPSASIPVSAPPVETETRHQALLAELSAGEAPLVPVDEVPPEPPSEVSSPEQAPEPVTVPGMVVYKLKPNYVPAEVYVIRAANDMIVSKGDYVIIPVHQEELLFSLSAAELASRYMPKDFVPPYHRSKVEPAAEKAPVTVEPLQVTAADEPEQAPVVKPAQVPLAVQQPTPEPELPPPTANMKTAAPEDDRSNFATDVEDEEILDEEIPEPPSVPHWRGRPSKQHSVVEEQEPRRRPQTPHGKIPYGTTKVAAQLGRIIAGVWFAQNHYKRSVTSGEAAKFMPPVDRKQIAARISAAEKRGWVQIDRSPGRYLYTVTRAGEAVVLNVTKDCYRASGFLMPPFVERLPARAC
jgi:hypothetical protein